MRSPHLRNTNRGTEADLSIKWHPRPTIFLPWTCAMMQRGVAIKLGFVITDLYFPLCSPRLLSVARVSPDTHKLGRGVV